MPEPQIKVALFDIAGTLTSVNVWKVMTNSTKVDEGRLRLMYARALPFWALYKLRVMSEVRFRHLWVKALAPLVRGWNETQLDDLFEWGVTAYLKPHYREDVVAELRELKAKGAYVVLVSNMFERFCDRFARQVGADKGLGTQLEFQNGVATGRVLGKAMAGDEKLERAHQFLKTQGIDVAFNDHAAAYADSLSDVALLAAAKFPTVTYPDSQMRQEAVKRGWRIIEESSS